MGLVLVVMARRKYNCAVMKAMDCGSEEVQLRRDGGNGLRPGVSIAGAVMAAMGLGPEAGGNFGGF